MNRNPQGLPDRDGHLQQALSEGRPAPGDAGVLADLRVRNIAEAVIHGGLRERARLGALIGELLTGGLEQER